MILIKMIMHSGFFMVLFYSESESLFCLLDRPSEGPEWDHNNTMGVPGYFISAGEPSTDPYMSIRYDHYKKPLLFASLVN